MITIDKGRTWEISGLYKTQKEPHSQQASGIVASSGGGRDDAPDNHAGRQVQGRLPELVEEEVGGDLHQQVAHEEDGHGRLVLGRRQPEVLLQARELGGRDVVPFFCWLAVSLAATFPSL